MAFCTKCGAQVPDGTPFCTKCGAPIAQAQPQAPAPAPAPIPGPALQQPQGQFMAPPPQPYQTAPQQQPYYAKPSADDHTAEFTADDVKKHKAIAAAFYSMIMMTFFVSIDGWGLTSLFTSLIDDVVAMFTRGYWSGSTGSIAGFAMIGVLAAVGTAAFKESAYVRFHGRMTFKLLFLAIISYLVRIIPVVGPVLSLLCSWFVIFIAFISVIFVLMGKSKEPIIVSALFKE